MDIKSKSIKISGNFIAWILVLVTAFSVVNTYKDIWKKTDKNKESIYESYTTFNILDEMSNALYMDVASARAGKVLTPYEVFASTEGAKQYPEVKEYVNEMGSLWKSILRHNVNVQYSVTDDRTNQMITTSSDKFYESVRSERLQEDYPFSLQLTYNEEGKAKVTNIFGADRKSIENFFETEEGRYDNTIEIYRYGEELEEVSLTLEAPKSMSITFAIPEDLMEYDSLYNDFYNQQRGEFLNQGFIFNSIIAVTFVFLISILLYAIKPLQIGRGFASKIPFEISVAGIFCVPFIVYFICESAFLWYFGYNSDVKKYFSESQIYNYSYIVHIILWFLTLGLVMIITLSLLQVFSVGLKRYCKEKILVIRFFYWLGRKVKKIYHSLITFDFTEKSNKIILRIVLINFLILLVLCSIWFFGIPILILYSIILYIILKRIYTNMKDKYSLLLKATNRMAQGDLDVDIEEDLGYFEPFKEEIKKIQTGFKKAVEEEVKSQSMKAELITNVSHDLKTPLTAIITYIDLLKNENITQEERDSYLNTLEQKSLRLKHLIEDLFEVSKATSRNIEVNFTEVDIVSLIKQAQYELSEQLNATGIDMRLQLPDEKIILNLDGQKTYRIFENLFINIIKYALPNTRAYVNLTDNEDKVCVELKNISATELNFNTENITDRFVRGDKSRTTEGSGLGLAIVKSFMELQGGELRIAIDGDLFKAILTFQK